MFNPTKGVAPSSGSSSAPKIEKSAAEVQQQKTKPSLGKAMSSLPRKGQHAPTPKVSQSPQSQFYLGTGEDSDDDWDNASVGSSENGSLLGDEEVDAARAAHDAAHEFELMDYEPEPFEDLIEKAGLGKVQLNQESALAVHMQDIKHNYNLCTASTVKQISRSEAAMNAAKNITPGQTIAAVLAGMQVMSNPIYSISTAAREVIKSPSLVDRPYSLARDAADPTVTVDSGGQLRAFVDIYNTPGRMDLIKSQSPEKAAVLMDLQDDLRSAARYSRHGEQREWQSVMTILTKQAEILSYPDKLHPILETCNFDKLKLAFGSEKERQVQTELTRIRKNANPEVPDEECVRAQLWIHGAPGVGKTLFSEMLAKETGLPVIVISNENNSVEKMFSAPPPKRRYEDPVSGDAHLGILAHAIIQSGCKNPIIVMDEFDDFFAANATRLKSYTNKDKHTLDGPGKTKIPFSRCTIIVIGNKPPSDVALAGRFTMIHKAYVSREDKEVIGNGTINELLTNMWLRHPTAAKWMDPIAQSLTPFVIEENEQRLIPGARDIKDILVLLVEQLEVKWENSSNPDDPEFIQSTIKDLKEAIIDRFESQHVEAVENPAATRNKDNRDEDSDSDY